MGSSLSFTLAGRYVTLTPLALEDVPALVHAASGDRSTYGWSIVPDSVDQMEVVVRRQLADRYQLSAVPFVTPRSDTAEIIGMTRFLTLRWFFDREFPDASEIGGTFVTAAAPPTPGNNQGKLLLLGHAFDV